MDERAARAIASVPLLTLAGLKRAILEAAADAAPSHVHKINLLGRPGQLGGLEQRLNVRFDHEQRDLAARTFDELRLAGLVRPTYTDLVDPENWVEITDAGREALREAAFREARAESPTTKELEQKFGILWSPAQAGRDFDTWAEADRTAGRPIAVLFMDIDNFKSLNTKYTETTVDDVILRPFQERLRELCASRGESYRQGGDEFVVLLRNCDPDEGRIFAERLRVQLGATSFRVGDEAIHVNISIGVASWPTYGETYQDILRLANAAKKDAKETRNTVRLAPSVSGKMGEQSGSSPKASADEIEGAIKWFEDPIPEVRRDAANQLLSLTYRKLIFHYKPVRAAIRRLMKDQDEEVRMTALQIHMALMRWERSSVGTYYSQPLIAVVEADVSPKVRGRAMATIGLTGDPFFCERVYTWIVQWPEDTYKQVDPVTTLVELAKSGLREKIRDDLRARLGAPSEPPVKARLNDALRRIRELS